MTRAEDTSNGTVCFLSAFKEAILNQYLPNTRKPFKGPPPTMYCNIAGSDVTDSAFFEHLWPDRRQILQGSVSRNSGF